MELKNKNIIFLIGFMGSGKTTLAKKVAKSLNHSFLDLDNEIEKREKNTISEIFKLKGENYFRETESKILKDIIGLNKPTVIALGGGTPCFYDNMEVIMNSGISFYLKYNAGILTSRLINAKVKRPLLEGLNEDELNKFISAKLNERESFYNRSSFVIEGKNIKVEDLVSLL